MGPLSSSVGPFCSGDYMRVLARIELLPTAAGGRTDPFTGSFRPNHRFDLDGFVIGEVEQQPGGALRPGESADLIVNFLPETTPTQLTAGMEWQIYDGPKHLIGHGTVLQVLSP